MTASGRRPADLVAACGVSIHAARAAVLRVRGRVPIDAGTGLTPKTVKNVHRALADAVAWEYLVVTRPSTPASPATNGAPRAPDRSRGRSTS